MTTFVRNCPSNYTSQNNVVLMSPECHFVVAKTCQYYGLLITRFLNPRPLYQLIIIKSADKIPCYSHYSPKHETMSKEAVLDKVFLSTNCPYRGVKVPCFGKRVKVLTGEFSAFTIKSLQDNTTNAIGKLNLKKI